MEEILVKAKMKECKFYGSGKTKYYLKKDNYLENEHGGRFDMKMFEDIESVDERTKKLYALNVKEIFTIASSLVHYLEECDKEFPYKCGYVEKLLEKITRMLEV